jgi:hypothetical protein
MENTDTQPTRIKTSFCQRLFVQGPGSQYFEGQLPVTIGIYQTPGWRQDLWKTNRVSQNLSYLQTRHSHVTKHVTARTPRSERLTSSTCSTSSLGVGRADTQTLDLLGASNASTQVYRHSRLALMAHRVQLHNPIYNLVTNCTRIIVPSICLSASCPLIHIAYSPRTNRRTFGPTILVSKPNGLHIAQPGSRISKHCACGWQHSMGAWASRWLEYGGMWRSRLTGRFRRVSAMR